MCRTNEESGMLVFSSVGKVCHMCGFSGVKGVVRGEGCKRQGGACGNEAVDSQYETGADKSSHPSTKGYHPKSEVLRYIC